MQAPMPSTIKARQGRFCLVRHASYNGGSTERVIWQVCEKLAPATSDSHSLWRIDREYERKFEALDWLSFVSKF